ncbi:cytochrome P450 2C31-like [Aplysia californica]|uniref:Cytochrome P450 2C31-like n=1 Tax=Aplysia californica TaxID=6500 RepID=A0ABM0K7Q9_APLCA|nr:cytochrome P450 2C31-like [Aplysia californica]
MARKYTRPRKDSIPGPPFLHGLRTVFAALRDNNLHQIGEIWAKQYGDLVEVNAGMGKIVFVNDSDLVRRLLCDPENRDITNDRPPTFVGRHFCYNYKNIITANFDTELVKRRKVFHTALKVYGDGANMLETLVLETSHDLQSKLKNYEGNVPLKNELSDLILRVVGLLLKGKLLVDTDLEVITNLVDTANKCFQFENETLMKFFPLARFIPGLKIKRLVDDLYLYRKELIDSIFLKVKEAYLQGEKSGIISELLDQQKKLEEEGQSGVLSDEVIITLILDIMAAAYLSTACTISGLFLYLIKDQNAQDRIHGEIQKVIGDSTPVFEHRRHMPYTDAAILEILRILTLAPFLVPHFANADLTIDGYTIPKGSTLLLNSWYFHHRDDHWDQPWTFQPERFLDGSGQLVDPEHPQRRKLMVFGTGRRLCPGENFARSRLFLVLVTLLQHFRFLPPSGEKLPSSHPKDWTLGTVFSPGNYQCRVELRA